MVVIIPNWHPIFVHFTVALFTTSVLFYWLSYLFSFSEQIPKKIFIEFNAVAHWCLWLTAIITIGTIIAGFYAFNTVRHDSASHLAMTLHRNWALSTAIAILLVTIWSFWLYLKEKAITLLFLIAVLIVQCLLIITAWHGGELVYRYGLGVMSLPHLEKPSMAPHKH